MNRQDVVLIHTCFAVQHPLQLCKCGLSSCPVAAKHLWRVYLGVFHGWRFSAGLTSLHSTSAPVIVLLLGKKSKILWPSPCQQMVASLTSLASGTQALPTDDSELYSLAHNNEPKSHLQSPDAKENKIIF